MKRMIVTAAILAAVIPGCGLMDPKPDPQPAQLPGDGEIANASYMAKVAAAEQDQHKASAVENAMELSR